MENQKNQFNLLKGNFNGEDAKAILATLLNDKMQYHRLRNLSHEERFGKPEPHAIERIAELKKTFQDIMSYLKQYEGNAEFEIHADISIRLVN